MTYLTLKYLHVLGGIVILGTGMGIAFFMLQAHRTGDVSHIFHTARTVVVADFLSRQWPWWCSRSPGYCSRAKPVCR